MENEKENELPAGWVDVLLGEICSFEYGKSLTKDNRNNNGQFDVYGSSGIVGKHSEALVDGPCIIVGRKGAVGEAYLSHKPCWPIDTAYYVENFGCYNILLLLFLLKYINLSSLDKSTAIPGLNRNDAYRSKILIPPLAEQHRIVAKLEELFSELDMGVETLRAAQQQLKVYRQAVLQWAFEGKLTEEWRKKQEKIPTYAELNDFLISERIKEEKSRRRNTDELTTVELSKLPAVPATWLWIKIDKLTKGVEYGTSEKSKKEGRIPVVRMGNIQNGKIVWEDLVYTDTKSDIDKYRLRPNDVLFNRTNSPELVGKTAIYSGQRAAIFAGYLIRLNQIDTLVDARYMNYYLNSLIAKKHGATVKTDGVNQSNINGEKLINYPFPYCSLPEQQQIVAEIESRLSVCDKLEETITQSLLQAEALRQSILKQAFAGKLVPQDPSDEPADKLLARIRAERAANPDKIKSSKRKVK